MASVASVACSVPRGSQRLTFHQLVQTGDLLEPIDGVDGSHPLGQIHIVRESSGQISQQGLKGSEAVWGDGVHNPFEVAVTVSVESNLLGFLLRAERLQRAGAVEAAVGTMCGTGQTVHSGPPAVPLRLVPLIKMLQLHISAERHDWLVCGICEPQKERQTQLPEDRGLVGSESSWEETLQ